MKPAGSEADQHVAGSDALGARNRVALGKPDGEAGDIVFAGPVESRHLRRFAADQTHAGEPASASDPFNQRQRDGALELAGRDVVEKEQRTRGMAHDVVHAHRNAIDTDRVVAPGQKRDFKLGPDTVGSRHQHRRAHRTRAVERDHRAEPADSA